MDTIRRATRISVPLERNRNERTQFRKGTIFPLRAEFFHWESPKSPMYSVLSMFVFIVLRVSKMFSAKTRYYFPALLELGFQQLSIVQYSKYQIFEILNIEHHHQYLCTKY